MMRGTAQFRGCDSMRHHFALVAVAVAALWPASLTGASASVDASGTAGALAGTWGTAEKVPGTAALNQGGIAEISSVSCASAGHCSASGANTDAPRPPPAVPVP